VGLKILALLCAVLSDYFLVCTLLHDYFRNWSLVNAKEYLMLFLLTLTHFHCYTVLQIQKYKCIWNYETAPVFKDVIIIITISIMNTEGLNIKPCSYATQDRFVMPVFVSVVLILYFLFGKETKIVESILFTSFPVDIFLSLQQNL
jgi:hypothetical protein